ncbi:Malonyl-CoA decarboxylase, C-terminal [Comamonadaceae bacterium]|nr:MAG: malonyl-CoA decarboxylase [Curvibacter sp.]
MTQGSWINRNVARLLPRSFKENTHEAPVESARAAPKKVANEGVAPASKRNGARSTRERLQATLRQGDEALSPRVLRRILQELQAVIDDRVSEVEGGRRAAALMAWYSGATPARRVDLWLLMSEMFVADPVKSQAAQAKFAAALGTPDEAAAEVHYRRATVSPRRRLLQRFSADATGIRFLVNLRAEMQSALKGDKRLQALDVEMEYMFSTWFDVGFLELRRISWDSPASLVEKLIKYEAVHDIKSWADVKNRLDSDRRCYGFFHPRLPDEPLIFVEVALVDALTDCITPLLDESADASDLNAATTAIFYSISNTQDGLRGVSFGDSLIKRVVETLKAEFPQLKTFATLSPIPGFRSWLQKNAMAQLEQLDDKAREELGRASGFEPVTAAHFLAAAESPLSLKPGSPVQHMLMRCAAQYLGRETVHGKPLDPVARFHLGNGARVERLNWAGDPSPKGIKQSYGLMVNYLYDLKRLDKHREGLASGRIPVASAVSNLFF